MSPQRCLVEMEKVPVCRGGASSCFTINGIDIASVPSQKLVHRHPECRLKDSDSTGERIICASIASRQAPNNCAASCSSMLDSPP